MKFKIKPWRHQHEAIQESIHHDSFALFFEQGTGKTLTCVNMLRMKYIRAKALLRTVIFCPNIVMTNWKKELLANSNLKEEDIEIIDGSGVMRVEKIKMVGRKAKILILSDTCFNMKPVMEALEKYLPSIMVIDESHRCKSLQAKRTKAAIRLADRIKHKFILTGTPILNSLMDVFAQYRILDGGRTFGRNFYAFRAKYFMDKNAGMPSQKYFPDWRPKPSASHNISKKMAETSRVVRKTECLDLPPLVKVPVEFELPPGARKHYEQLKHDFVTYIEGDACVAQLAITKALRLQQIASGYLQLDSGNTIKFDTREKVLKELLADKVEHSKVIIWAVFKENYKSIRRVCDELRIEYVEVHGDVDAKTKDKAVERFSNCDDVRVYIGHPGSGGIGVNLTASNCSVVYSRTWNLEFELQSEARNWRGGSEIHSKITRYDLVAKNTIDEKIMQILSNKEKMSLRVLKGIAADLKESFPSGK